MKNTILNIAAYKFVTLDSLPALRSTLRQLGEKLGFSKIRVGAKTAMLDFGPQPRIEPIKLIKLIQSQPRVYKLEGQKRLNITAKELEEPGGRAALLTALLQRLAAPADPKKP